ncbi:MAG: polyprenyl synthetase family protein [Nitrospira sp.]
MDHMDTPTVEAETIEGILSRYEPYLQICRSAITIRLKEYPHTAVLTRYFDRGKMFRALLTFAATSATGGNLQNMIKVAASIELLHGGSLIHDDIIDEATSRRGLPALHQKVGIGPAIVLGDYLILCSMTVLLETEALFEPSKVRVALQVLSDDAQACCRGELRELLPSPESDLEKNYLAIIRGKTASQFAAAVALPVILGGGGPDTIRAMRRYGLYLGIAFQIHDDMLDLIGDTNILGKPVGASLVKGRPMLPLIYLERYGSEAACQVGRQLLREIEYGGHAELVTLLREEGIFDRVMATRDEYVSRALQALDQLGCSTDLEVLRTLATCAATHQFPHTLFGAAAPQDASVIGVTS